MAHEDALVKGEPVLQMLGYVKKRKGMKGVNQVLGFTNNKHSTKYKFSDFKDMDWYSQLHYDSMLEGMEQVFPDDDKMFTKACTHFLDNYGIMKYFVKFAMSPQQLMRKASKDFNKFYSTGVLTVEDMKKKHARIKLSEFPFTDHWNRSFAGFLEALCIHATGAQEVDCKIETKADENVLSTYFLVDWE